MRMIVNCERTLFRNKKPVNENETEVIMNDYDNHS